MSSIKFTSPAGSVRVSGRERAAMSVLCQDFLKMQMNLHVDDLAWIEATLPQGHYLQSYINDLTRAQANGGNVFHAFALLRERFNTYISVGNMSGGADFYLAGAPVDLFSLQLNSAIERGNRSVQLAAKFHAQCEIHAFCEGADRSWLADAIDEAVECGVFRADPFGYDGWTAVCAMLRLTNREPVVTSYSVCESFPGPHCVPDDIDMGDDPWEAWDDLSEDQRWQYGMDHVRASPSLKISPDRIGCSYNHGLSGRTFIEAARELANPDSQAFVARATKILSPQGMEKCLDPSKSKA